MIRMMEEDLEVEGPGAHILPGLRDAPLSLLPKDKVAKAAPSSRLLLFQIFFFKF